MELNDYLRLLRRYWRGVSVLALVGVLAAAGLTILQPRVYQADASGFVSAGGSSSASEASISDLLAKSRAASYVDLATSRATARAVIADLGLTVDPAALIGAVSVTRPLDTVLIKVSARAGTPRGAQALADAWVRALKRQVDAIENPRGRRQAGSAHRPDRVRCPADRTDLSQSQPIPHSRAARGNARRPLVCRRP